MCTNPFLKRFIPEQAALVAPVAEKEADSKIVRFKQRSNVTMEHAFSSLTLAHVQETLQTKERN